MIQLVVNVELLREIDERKLINAYARFMYNDEELGTIYFLSKNITINWFGYIYIVE